MRLSANATRIILGALTLFCLAAPVMLWNGKWTFLIANYKKFDPDKTDMTKLHHVNAAALAVAELPLCVLVWMVLLRGNRVFLWVGIVWSIGITLAEYIYEKTGNRFPKKDQGTVS